MLSRQPGLQGASGDNQPDEDDGAEDERFDACLAQSAVVGGHAQRRHRHGEQPVVEGGDGVQHGGRQVDEGVDEHDADEGEREPRDDDTAAGAVVVGVAAHTVGEREEEGCEHHHPDHFGGDGEVGDGVVDGFARRDHLRHFVHAGADVDAKGRVGNRPPLRRVHVGVEEDADGAVDDDGGDGDDDVVRFCPHHGSGGDDGGGAADAAARAHQPDGVAFDVQPADANPAGEEEGGGEHDGVGEDAVHADGGNLRECQAETVEDDAKAQQLPFAEDDAFVAMRGDARVEGIADEHADEDGERQHTEAHPRQMRLAAGKGGEDDDGEDGQHADDFLSHDGFSG